jgi:hypothetical protein
MGIYRVDGWNGSSYVTGSLINTVTTQAWTTAGCGSEINFAVVPNGSTGLGNVAIFSANAGCQVQGTQTNDNAQAGWVGEYLTATSATLTPANNTPFAVIAVTLTPGDWDVGGSCSFSGTTMTNATAGITTTAATFPASPLYAGLTASITACVLTVPEQRISATAVTQTYVNAQASFVSGTCSVVGAIWARRRR